MGLTRHTSKLKARIFFEVMGWPAEALTKHLKDVLNKLRKQWKISDEKYETPIPIDEKNPKMLTAHVEFEAEIPNIADLIMFSILYGPSVVEILEPSEIYLKSSELQDILADVISKIQLMDKDIKLLAAQNKILRSKLADISPEREREDKEIKL